MIINGLQDMRDAVEKMAQYNRMSVSALNDISKTANGVLRRFLRVTARRRLGGVLVDETVETDIKLGALLNVIETAGWEMIVQPKQTGNRRQRVREAARQNGSPES